MSEPSHCQRCQLPLERVARAGRVYHYRNGVEFEIPSDVPVLSCTTCNETYLADADVVEIERRLGLDGPDVDCPHCKVNLVESAIPEEYRRHFGRAWGGRGIIVCDPNNDESLHYECPDCGGHFPVPQPPAKSSEDLVVQAAVARILRVGFDDE